VSQGRFGEKVEQKRSEVDEKEVLGKPAIA
jgi:hypothetical protein